MNYLLEGLCTAIEQIVALDRAVYAAAWRSLWISTLAVALAALVGLPLGSTLARARFPGKRLVVLCSRVGMAFPTVFIGLVCFAMFSRRGPLGVLDMLYTPWAIVSGEFLLALPIIVSITHGAVHALDPRVAETAWTLGASRLRRWFTYLSEARTGVTIAVLMAFARCVTELGIAVMVGGNIQGRTRTLATATAMETGKGEFELGLAMGMLLLVVALFVTVVIGLFSNDNGS